MKLICNVPPRRGNTTVTAVGKSGAKYEFNFDAGLDALVGEVSDLADVGCFLALPGDRFEPADEADYDTATALMTAAVPKDPEGGDGDDDEDGDEEDDDPIDPDAPPVEANTAPKPPKDPKAPKAPKVPKPPKAPAAT